MTTLENRRFALLAALGVVGFLLWQAWQAEYANKAGEARPAATAPADGRPAGDVPAATTSPAVAAGPGATAAGDAVIKVETDVLSVEISALGGDLQRLLLKGYPVAKNKQDQHVALLDDQPERWFVVQSGLVGAGGPVASFKDRFTAASGNFALGSADEVEVPLTFRAPSGVTVTKTYRFRRGSYLVELAQAVDNGSGAALALNPYVQMWRTPFAAGDEPPFTKPFMGVGLYEQKEGTADYKFRKLAFKDVGEEPLEKKQTGGWLAMLQHYFLVAVIPPGDEPLTFIAKPNPVRGYAGQYIGAARDVPAGGTARFDARLYAGPLLQKNIDKVAPGFELTLDYGILKPFAGPLFWLLDWFYQLTHNWGVAIILLTLAVRGSMYKLSEAQYRSQAKMRKFAPRIQELKERHGEDREKLNQAMMELYKKEKFNPLAGCWPLLIQMPVFLALFWVLLQSVELRQADFAFWLNDLSSPDPFYILPALYCVSMIALQKMTPVPVADPVQQRVMNLMPYMLGVFFAFFPVGLVLYWLVSNCISIALNWYIQRKLTKEGLGHR
jgi:YidC/Oxa1 family membrane protein insertase